MLKICYFTHVDTLLGSTDDSNSDGCENGSQVATTAQESKLML